MAQALHGARDTHARTPAQWYCLLAGAALLLAGIFGFIADATFDAGSNLQGDSFLGFEVNGWHNVVHVLSGIVLLAAFSRRKPARTVALAFGVVYGLVTIIGLVDGNDVLGLIPVNAADNVLHLALSAAGILAAFASPGDDHRRTGRDDRVTTVRTDGTDVDDERGARFGRPINAADNVLHIALAAVGILAAVASPGGEPLRTTTSAGTRTTPAGDREARHRPADVDPLTGAPHDREHPTR